MLEYLCNSALSDAGHTACECSGCTFPLYSAQFCRSSEEKGQRVDVKCFSALIFSVVLVAMNGFIWLNQGNLEKKSRMQEITPALGRP